MKSTILLSTHLRRFFTQRLLTQARATSNTIATYRDTYRLLIRFAEERTGREPVELRVADIDADLIKGFLVFCEDRGNSLRTRNTRLSAIRSFFRYVGDSEPKLRQQCEEVLEISRRKSEERVTDHLNAEEVRAILEAADCSSRLRRRDRTLLLLIMLTGLRASALIGLRRRDVELSAGAHVRWRTSKNQKERVTLLDAYGRQALRSWIEELKARSDDLLFLSRRGTALSQDTVQQIVRKYARRASEKCPTLATKRVTPHMLRRTRAILPLGESAGLVMSPFNVDCEPPMATGQRIEANVELAHVATAHSPGFESERHRPLPKDNPLEFLRSL